MLGISAMVLPYNNVSVMEVPSGVEVIGIQQSSKSTKSFQCGSSSRNNSSRQTKTDVRIPATPDSYLGSLKRFQLGPRSLLCAA
jgi:hypothetical protein